MDAASIEAETVEVVGDVTSMADLGRLRDETLTCFGGVHLLVNNVGLIRYAGPWDAPQAWTRTLDVNFTAVLAAQHLVVPGMVASDEPAAFVNLGSKEGITMPPGNAAY